MFDMMNEAYSNIANFRSATQTVSKLKLIPYEQQGWIRTLTLDAFDAVKNSNWHYPKQVRKMAWRHTVAFLRKYLIYWSHIGECRKRNILPKLFILTILVGWARQNSLSDWEGGCRHVTSTVNVFRNINLILMRIRLTIHMTMVLKV